MIADPLLPPLPRGGEGGGGGASLPMRLRAFFVKTGPLPTLSRKRERAFLVAFALLLLVLFLAVPAFA